VTGKNWAEKLADLADRAVEAAQEAWDSTEETRSEAWGSVVESANQVGTAATEATAKAKESWQRSGTHGDAEPDAESVVEVDVVDAAVEQELREAIADEEGDTTPEGESTP